jgi:hypothetical protein
MVNIFAKIINPQAILKMQNLQYQEKLLLEDTVPASSSKLGKISISSLGHFYCQFLTGHFETLSLDEAAIKDDGVSHLRAKFSDGSNQRQLFNDYVPLDLFLTPGRVKSSDSTTLLTDPVSNNLFYPQIFQYLFAVNSDILVDVKNDSDVELDYAIVFHGIRVPEARR